MPGTAAEAAYHRGDHPRAEWLARTGLERATDARGSWLWLAAWSVVALARGAHTEVVEHSQAAAALTTRPRENLGIAALAVAYSRDLDQARTLNKQGLVGAVSPTMLAWGAYVAGEIESLAGDSEPAEHHCKPRVIGAPSRDAQSDDGVEPAGVIDLYPPGASSRTSQCWVPAPPADLGCAKVRL